MLVVSVAVCGAADRRPASREPRSRHDRTLAELEAAREAKYREIRDTELDHRTGKLSDADFAALDRTLRAEAVEILRAIDRGAEQPTCAGYHRAPDEHDPQLVQVFICVVLVFLILMHSGKDAGLSGAFGVGTGTGPLGGGSLVERNLNRWTIGFAIAFVVNTIILIKIC